MYKENTIREKVRATALGDGISGCQPTAAPTARMTEVATETSDLEHAVDRLERITGALIERLSPVLRPWPANPEGSGKNDMPALVPFAEELRAKNQRLQRVGNTLEAILGQIEL